MELHNGTTVTYEREHTTVTVERIFAGEKTALELLSGLLKKQWEKGGELW